MKEGTEGKGEAGREEEGGRVRRVSEEVVVPQ